MCAYDPQCSTTTRSGCRSGRYQERIRTGLCALEVSIVFIMRLPLLIYRAACIHTRVRAKFAGLWGVKQTFVGQGSSDTHVCPKNSATSYTIKMYRVSNAAYKIQVKLHVLLLRGKEGILPTSPGTIYKWCKI